MTRAPSSILVHFSSRGFSPDLGFYYIIYLLQQINQSNKERKKERKINKIQNQESNEEGVSKMQAGKNPMSSVKETAANIVFSAASGMEKTKAVVQEKVDKMTAHDPIEKEMAEQRKEERIREAEMQKQEAMQRYAAALEHAGGQTGGPTTTEAPHTTTVPPGVVAGHPSGGYVEEGMAGSRPLGVAPGTTSSSSAAAAHNPQVGSTEPVARGTGGLYD